MNTKFDLLDLVGTPWVGRVRVAAERLELRYTALDPILAPSPEDHEPGLRLADLRQHLVRLHAVVMECDHTGLLVAHRKRAGGWEGVRHALQMAASLRDVVADTGATDPHGSPMMCRPAYEYERARSETASKYMAGLVMFNFLWSAYENARELSEFGAVLTGRTPDKGEHLRRLSSGLADSLPLLRNALFEAVRPCLDGRELGREVSQLKPGRDGSYALLAGDLLRRVRHYLFHGKDAVPEPLDWGDEDEDERRRSHEQPPEVLRLFALSRLLALMVQLIAFSCLSDPEASIFDYLGDDYEDREAGWQLSALHLERPALQDALLPFGAPRPG